MRCILCGRTKNSYNLSDYCHACQYDIKKHGHLDTFRSKFDSGNVGSDMISTIRQETG